MKDAIAGIELRALTKEFQTLVKGRIDKIYQDDTYFLWQLYASGKRVNLKIDIPERIYVTEHKPQFKAPKGFCMFLRKRLQTGRIQSIEQLGVDRILKFIITQKNKQNDNITIYHLYMEFFGKGNLIVCDEKDKIISLLDSVTFADRELRGGVVYQPPQPQIDYTTLSKEEFKALFAEDKPIVVTLASTLGLGGEYAELLLERAGIEKNAQNPDLDELYACLQQLLEEYDPQHTENAAYPVQFHTNAITTETFSQAIAAVWDGQRAEEKENALLKREKKELSKTEKVLQKQTEQIERMEQQAAQYQRTGELLYEHYQEISELIAQAKADRRSMDATAFKVKYEKHPRVTRADPQHFEIELGGKDE